MKSPVKTVYHNLRMDVISEGVARDSFRLGLWVIIGGGIVDVVGGAVAIIASDLEA